MNKLSAKSFSRGGIGGGGGGRRVGLPYNLSGVESRSPLGQLRQLRQPPPKPKRPAHWAGGGMSYNASGRGKNGWAGAPPLCLPVGSRPHGKGGVVAAEAAASPTKNT